MVLFALEGRSEIAGDAQDGTKPGQWSNEAEESATSPRHFAGNSAAGDAAQERGPTASHPAETSGQCGQGAGAVATRRARAARTSFVVARASSLVR